MFSYNTIINFTELYIQDPNSTCAGLQFKVQQPAPAGCIVVVLTLVCEPWKVFQPGP